MNESGAAAAVGPLFAAAGETAERRWLLYAGARPLLIPDTAAAVQRRCVRFFSGPGTALAAPALAALTRLVPAMGRPLRVAGPGVWQAAWPAGRELGVVDGAVQIGTAGPYQKAAVLLVDRDGRPFAVSKVAMGPRADAMIDAEAQNLSRLAAVHEMHGRVPRLLDSGTTRGGRRFLVTDLAPSRRAGGALGEAHKRFLAALARVTGEQGRYRDAAGMERPAAALARLAPQLPAALAALLQRAAGDCRDGLGNRAGPLLMAHGDFAPWNLRRGAGGLYAFDWEYAWHGAPPAYDPLHYLLLPRALSRRRVSPAYMDSSIAAVGRMLEELHPRWRWDRGLMAALALQYLLDVVLFYGMADGFIDLHHPVIFDYLRLIEARSLWMP